MKWVGMPISAKPQHDKFGNPVIQNAFAVERGLFLGIKGRGVVLEILDEGAFFRPFIKNFGFAFVNLFAAAHRIVLR